MIIAHYFDKNTSNWKRFVFLKRNNRRIEYKYFLDIDCLGNFRLYSVRKYVKKEIGVFLGKRYTVIKKKTYRCYRKVFNEWV